MLTLQDAKAQLNIPAANTDHDTEIQDYIAAVTGVVENYTSEVVETREVVEHHHVISATRLMMLHRPVISLVTVATADGNQSWNTADLYVASTAGELAITSGPALSGFVVITAMAGYETIPDHYNLAARIILAHLWRTQRGVSGAPFVGGGGGQEMQAGTGFAVPRRAEQLLGPTHIGVA